MRILLVDDDKLLNQTVSKILSTHYVVDSSYTGKKALYLIETISYDLIILDLNLPDISGQTILKEIRNNEINSHILILTNNHDIDSKIEELNSGADDYLTKPFNKEELEARVKALLRRKSSNKKNIYQVKQLVLNHNQHQVSYANQKINLCRKEYQLLYYLFNQQGRIITPYQIYEHLWENVYEYQSNTVAVHVNRLRRKIDKKFKTEIIQTIRGYGYRLVKE